MTKIYVGMSGGVDSSVTAALLKEQGHDVTGVYMKNWTQELPGFVCPWREDLADAKRVAVQLGIPFKVFDFQKEYKQLVVDYMIDEYKAGRTPNPDIVCNQEVKFRLFLESSLQDGAEAIATGHYAQVKNGALYKAKDQAKDQTYFLYRVTSDALQKTLMPIGDYEKTEVRKLAQERGLATARKSDSQGICFVGEVGIRAFLEHYVAVEPGPIKDEAGKTIGEHDGAIFYTIGQRHGLKLGGGLPYYVTGKDMRANTVFVNRDLNELWRNEFDIADAHWINETPLEGKPYDIRTRHRAPLVSAEVSTAGRNKLRIKSDEPIRAVTPGQSAVFYEGDRVVGGGIII